MRLRSGELGAPLIGELRISDQAASSFARAVRVAQLWQPTASAVDRPLGLPLFDPVIVHMCAESFSLAGVELSGDAGRVREFVQVWRCSVVHG